MFQYERETCSYKQLDVQIVQIVQIKHIEIILLFQEMKSQIRPRVQKCRALKNL